ncbi:MAG TPA: NADH-quinone oxidoreductase subunit C [Candidatus Binatia bacterium]|jgi:NADH-quinone oxidoreductase subunit C
MADETPQLEEIRRVLGDAVIDAYTARGEDTIVIGRDGVVDSFKRLKEDPALGFDFLSDLTAVDYLGKKEPRFEVVYHLMSLGSGRRVRVKVPVAESAPEVDSLVPLWRAADWLEREVWDMFGIRFRGHPDLRRILLYEEFRGYPLRKDYPVNERQPLVPERPLKGTFVDTRSGNKLAQLKQQLERQKLSNADSKRG